MKRLIILLLVLSFVLPVFPINAENEDNEIKNENIQSNESSIKGNYFDYLEGLTYSNLNKTIEFDADYTKELTVNEKINFDFTVSDSSVFVIELEYNTKNCKDDFVVSFKIDGEYLFEEMSSLKMPKIWVNASEKRKDSIGNESAPQQVLWDGFTKQHITDSEGVALEPYRFGVNAGQHNVEFEIISGSVYIKKISLLAPFDALNYKDYKKSHSNAKNYKGSPIVVEGEDAVYKTDKSLIPKADNSDPSLSPASATVMLLNTIGFNSWNTPGEAISWEIDVPSDGFYKLGFKFKQSESINNVSYRQLLIDGEIPFSEAKSVSFDYGNDWQYTEFSKGNKDYLIYLEKGKHTITMSATLSRTADYYRRLEEIVNDLGDIYINISMITGENPDKKRDYDLFCQIPDLNKRLNQNYKALTALASEMNKSTQMSGSSMISALKNMARVLKSMIDNPYTAQVYLTDYYSNYTSVGGWLYDMKSMPLCIDRIILCAPEKEVKDVEASFFEKIYFAILRFFASFSQDYNVLGTTGEAGAELKIWVNWGRDQAEILGNMISDDFTPKHNINVKLEIVNAGIVKGILAGNPPDLSLHMARSEPVNLAMRDALCDLTKFDGYDDVIKRFADTATVPYTYNGGVYALPDTQSFYIMYCRTDILEKLNIEIPKTWDEFIQAAVTIQRNNMQVWLPYLKITTATTVNTGVGGLSLFPTLVHQNGLRMYNDEGNACTLGDEDVLSVFNEWTEFYTEYKFPKEVSFYNRFRIGTIPLGIEQYTTYQTLVNAAPEIRDDWTIAEIPGVIDENGNINNAVAGSGTGCGIIKGTGNEKAAWEFIRWWTDAETQFKYSDSVETVLGSLGRVASANMEAVSMMSWKKEDLNVILSAWEKLEEVEEVPGSYYLTRAVDQAYWAVVNGTSTSKEALMIWSRFADNEIKRKIKEYS